MPILNPSPAKIKTVPARIGRAICVVRLLLISEKCVAPVRANTIPSPRINRAGSKDVQYKIFYSGLQLSFIFPKGDQRIQRERDQFNGQKKR